MRGVILAGGGATRFGGRPKGLEQVEGRRILDRLSDACRTAFNLPPLLVTNDPAAASWLSGLEIVPDVMPGHGALGGLLTAVEAGPAPVVVVAWDMPFVPAALLQRLGRGLDEADACLPASPGRRGVEPLCAAYGPQCAPAIRAALAANDLRLVAFHDAMRVSILPLSEVSLFGEPARLFANINTPEDLDRARSAPDDQALP